MTRQLYTQYLNLQSVGIVVGLLLVAFHAFALKNPGTVKQFLKELPRNRNLGIVILAIDCVWVFWLIGEIDLGEFQRWVRPIRFGLPVAFVFFIIYVDEFLAVRAIGIFLLLVACPILDVAFLQDPSTRLLLPALSYIWIFFALFWIGMPYLMRDHIAWAVKTKRRWEGLSAAGIAYGLTIIICALAFWGSGSA